MHFIAALALAVCLSGCGGGGGGGGGSASSPAVVTIHSVTISWEPNRESSVNRAGGGYQVFISGQPTINVPYTSGALAPSALTTSLQTGSYAVTIRAYGALDAQGGNSGSISEPSQQLVVNVP